jgi:4a-hydroxytetrahydrobiopterin dehydratase
MRLALDTAQLRSARCTHAGAADKLSPAEVAAQFVATPLWRIEGHAIERAFRFADFKLTMAFVNAVAGVADAQDHHPHLTVEYDRCTLRFSTHSAGGITRNDFICAAKIDALPADV